MSEHLTTMQEGERAEFNAWYASQPMPQLLARMDPQQAAYNAWLAGRRAAIPEQGELPPLPFDDSPEMRDEKITVTVGTLTGAMREYGAACRAGVKGGHLGAVKSAETRMDSGFSGGLLGEADARDAARYRWLRDESAIVHGDVPTVFVADYPADPDWNRMLHGDSMDMAIDAAIESAATAPERKGE